MLKDFVKVTAPEEEVLREQIRQAREELEDYQLKIKEAKLPVMVLFEGWGAAGKGSVIGKVIRNIDPRFFKVKIFTPPTEEERRYPFLYRYMQDIPEGGKFTFYDTFWMEEVTTGVLNGELSEEDYQKRIDSINRTERSLKDNGYLIVKFFFQIGKKEQKKRLDRLEENKNTAWRVDKHDRKENKNYDECLEVYDKFLIDTDYTTSPWHIVDAETGRVAELQVLQYLNQAIAAALQNQGMTAPILQNTFPMRHTPLLSEISLEDKTLSEEEYKQQLDALQKELRQLQYKLYRKKIPMVLVYEGWDAAGKGGNIKRITAALDPRGFVVNPVASPEPHEKARHYLWRFWNKLPKTGHIAIFDRSWYGRVMVERLEGYCSENDWQRAYHEMNEFEKELTDWGCVVIKFWVQIDKDTQLKRFEDRQSHPEKVWKITEEDWRNREKWDDYEVAVNEMLQKTSTEFAPWHILESVDKKYARIKALQIVTEEMRKAAKK